MKPNEKVNQALQAAVSRVSRYYQLNVEPPYAVWMEEGAADTVHADNRLCERSVRGTIHYFTRQEDDPAMERIERELTAAEISFRWNSTQYEEDTGILHYEWIWEAV